MTEPLTETERLTFGALLRAHLRLDTYTTSEEQTVLHSVAAEILGMVDAPEMAVADALAALLERSAEHYPDDRSVRAAAEAVTGQEARETIYGAIYEISSAGTITVAETGMLDWLAERWQIRVRDVEPPAG